MKNYLKLSLPKKGNKQTDIETSKISLVDFFLASVVELNSEISEQC